MINFSTLSFQKMNDRKLAFDGVILLLFARKQLIFNSLWENAEENHFLSVY